MKPAHLRSKIFLDSGDPAETREALSILGFLDGQTTNPSLVAKNPAAAGKRFSQSEIMDFYRGVVKEISALIPQGSVSIEVYADARTSAEQMLEQGREFFKWIPNAHIKYPTTTEGLKAAQISVADGMRVNMTLVFSQEQAAAVYAATAGAQKGDVFISPFIGRLDDIGLNGLDLIANIIKMYQPGDGHVAVLTASVRSVEHVAAAIALGTDILTAPLHVLKDWAAAGFPQAPATAASRLRPMAYERIALDRPWQEYEIHHELTEKGLQKFSEDWNKLIG